MPQCITDLTRLYTNYKHTGLWDETAPNPKVQLIALATQLWKKIKANKDGKGGSGKPDKQGKAGEGKTPDKKSNLAKWLFKNVGASLSAPDGKNYERCKHHGRKTDGVPSGMYMPAPHDHDEWQVAHDAKVAR